MEDHAKSIEEQAQEAKEYLDDILEVARKYNLTRPLMITLLGLFARHCVNLDVAEGTPEPDAVMEVVGQFMGGLGLHTAAQKVEAQELPPEMLAMMMRGAVKTTLQ
jgi:hypothetical protein